MLDQLLSKPLLNNNIDIISIIMGFSLAAALGFILSIIYKRLNRGRENLHFMMQSLIVLSITIAAAMMIVGNELARAFGLVGAVSVIRFRTAVQNYRDMAFVFIAIVVGMACGLQFYFLASIVGLFTGGLLFLLGIIGYGSTGITYKNCVLRINFTNNGLTREDIERELRATIISFHFQGMKTNVKKSWYEYRIQVKNKKMIDNLIDTMKQNYSENDIVIRICQATK
jgi:uncharacterized membrane protein YhiD involved in acid resistance